MLPLIRGKTLHYHNHGEYQRPKHRSTLIAQAALKQHHRKISALRAFSFPDNSEKTKKITEKFQSQFKKENPDLRSCWQWAQWQNLPPIVTPTPTLMKISQELTKEQFHQAIDPILALPLHLQGALLEQYIFEDSLGGISRFNEYQIKAICKILYKADAYELLIEVFEKKIEIFRKHPGWLFLYCSSNLKSCYINPNKILNILHSFSRETRNDFKYYEIKALTHIYKCYLAKEVATMFKSRQINKDVLEKYFQSFRNYSESDALNHYKKELGRSIAALKKAITIEYNDKYCIYLIYQLFEANQIKKAYQIAKIAYETSFLEKGADVDTFSHHQVRAILITALISDANILLLDLLTERLIVTCQKANQQTETINSFELLGEHIAHPYINIILKKIRHCALN